MKKKIYIPSFGEEVANTITHGVIAFLILLALPFSAVKAYMRGQAIDAITVSIFVISIFLMFLGSTLYHAMEHDTNQKKILHILDHIFIYVAIAGSYTPIALLVIKGWQGIVVTIIQWSMVIVGILYKSLSKKSVPKASVTVYLIMGWTAALFLPLLYTNASFGMFASILVGGLFYSAGAAFYAFKGFKYHHMVWHIMVFLGALSHYIGIVFLL